MLEKMPAFYSNVGKKAQVADRPCCATLRFRRFARSNRSFYSTLTLEMTMERKRELILANLLSLLVVVAALAAGWRQEALFGLAVLAVMDAIVLIRQRFGRRDKGEQE